LSARIKMNLNTRETRVTDWRLTKAQSYVPPDPWKRHRSGFFSCGGVPVEKLEKTLEEWKADARSGAVQRLPPESHRAPFTGKYNSTKTDGVYHCVCCNEPLFDSPPSSIPAAAGRVSMRRWKAVRWSRVRDVSHGMIRTEVVCSKCDAHLGHVFPDGPPPTGLRYCINSVCLELVPRS
jgi:methionine-R-sulfoxide reductase